MSGAHRSDLGWGRKPKLHGMQAVMPDGGPWSSRPVCPGGLACQHERASVIQFPNSSTNWARGTHYRVYIFVQ
jgi:hypothetical protein